MNHKCERYYTRESDGLNRDWSGEVVWCNPPYSNIRPWVVKAWESKATVVMLVPANRTEQKWWQDLIEPHRDRGGRLSVRFIAGRLKFTKPGAVKAEANSRPPFGVCVLVWEKVREWCDE